MAQSVVVSNKVYREVKINAMGGRIHGMCEVQCEGQPQLGREMVCVIRLIVSERLMKEGNALYVYKNEEAQRSLASYQQMQAEL